MLCVNLNWLIPIIQNSLFYAFQCKNITDTTSPKAEAFFSCVATWKIPKFVLKILSLATLAKHKLMLVTNGDRTWNPRVIVACSSH